MAKSVLYPSRRITESVAPSLLQVEQSNTELSVLLEKARMEEATLRDSLVKMSALNQALAEDKEAQNKLLEEVGLGDSEPVGGGGICARFPCSNSSPTPSLPYPRLRKRRPPWVPDSPRHSGRRGRAARPCSGGRARGRS